MNHRWSFTYAALLALGACAEPPLSHATEPESTESDLVGVANLALMERTFGLERDTKTNGVWSRDITLGRCHQAYAANDPTVQSRRYKNGAAFFRSHSPGDRTRGHDRPVLCVDLDLAETAIALDGIALDAVFRFDLGKPLGVNGAPGGEAIIAFERGTMHMLLTEGARGPTAEEASPARRAKGANLVAAPIALDGWLLSIEQLDSDGPISGALVALAHVVAETRTGSAFAMDRDPLGRVRATSNIVVDGMDMRRVHLENATLTETHRDGIRTLHVFGPTNPEDPWNGGSDSFVRCVLTDGPTSVGVGCLGM